MKFHFAEAFRILMKTVPYLLLRLLIYGLLAIGTAVYLLFVALIATVFGGAGALVFIIGLVILAGLFRLAKQYLLYLVKAGHVAVITELLQRGSLPEGVNQVQYGKEKVTRMFKEVSVLFVIDRLILAIIRTFNRVVARIADILPIPGLEGLAKIINSILNFSLTFIDETILSYNLSRGNENVWESSKRGVILYAQNWKAILTSAAGIAVLNFVGFIVLFLILLIPFAPLALLTTSGVLKFFFIASAFTIAYGIKLAVFSPFFLITMIITFNRAIEGQEPNPEWESKLDKVSGKFRELKDKAREHAGERPAPLAPQELRDTELPPEGSAGKPETGESGPEPGVDQPGK